MPRPSPKTLAPSHNERQIDLLDVLHDAGYPAPTLDRAPTTGAQAAAGGLDCQPPQRKRRRARPSRQCDWCARFLKEGRVGLCAGCRSIPDLQRRLRWQPLRPCQFCAYRSQRGLSLACLVCADAERLIIGGVE